MAYTLVVKVSGLCLFVPKDEGRTLWGLMVKARGHGHGGHHVPEHLPVVAYDPADVDPPQPPEGECNWRLLRGATYTVGGPPGPDMGRSVRAIPGNFSKIHGKRAPASWFNAGGEALFTARVRITGTASLAPEGGARWLYGQERKREPKRLPTRIACTIPMANEAPIDLETAQGRLTLQPKAGQTLNIEFHNVPVDQLPPCGGRDFPKPGPCDPPEHFDAYRQFLKVMDAERPCYVDDGDQFEADGINPYACLTLPGCSEEDPDCEP